VVNISICLIVILKRFIDIKSFNSFLTHFDVEFHHFYHLINELQFTNPDGLSSNQLNNLRGPIEKLAKVSPSLITTPM
jgi:hypothetical protein